MFDIIERSDVVHSGSVVLMLMCEQYGIKALDVLPEHLLPEIRAGVDDDRFPARLYQHRCPKPLVAGIGGTADLALAGNNRNTLRSAGTQDCYFQLAYYKWGRNTQI